jgi:L-fuconate dehydratase
MSFSFSPCTIVDVIVHDIRFPTSDDLIGSDSVHTDPDYSCVYVQLITDCSIIGCGLSFTIGRGNEIVQTAVHAMKVTQKK